jgi:hypothetical protein
MKLEELSKKLIILRMVGAGIFTLGGGRCKYRKEES